MCILYSKIYNLLLNFLISLISFLISYNRILFIHFCTHIFCIILNSLFKIIFFKKRLSLVPRDCSPIQVNYARKSIDSHANLTNSFLKETLSHTHIQMQSLDDKDSPINSNWTALVHLSRTFRDIELTLSIRDEAKARASL